MKEKFEFVDFLGLRHSNVFCYIVDGMFISKLPMEVGNDGNLRMIQKT